MLKYQEIHLSGVVLVKDFSTLFTEEFNTQRDQWEKALKAELKLDDISPKTSKKHLDLGAWPTLSTSASEAQHLPTQTDWKKASQTYLQVDEKNLAPALVDDLESGVRVFFFNKDFINDEKWSLIEKTLGSFTRSDEIEVYLLGQKKFNVKSSLKIIDESQMIIARSVHEEGGHNVHELALLTTELIERLDQKPSHIALFLDSHFFKNIAKVRAMKLLAEKVYKTEGLSHCLKFITLNSYREWTLFERYSNMLRNNAQVASAYISGADVIQSSGYQLIFDLETSDENPEHNERSRRMARNTSHILGLESMLGMVADAAYGSFHLENLSHEYAASAWKLMQELLPMDASSRKEKLDGEILKVRDTRMDRVKTRKDILAGMNDFPDGKEHLNVTLKESTLFRVSRSFEELRLKVETLQSKPKVQIMLKGDYAALNNRVNFIKNYFELIGLEVIDPIHSHGNPTQKIIVLCAKDEDYPALATTLKESAVAKFVAGKVEVPDFTAIYAGQNVHQVLSQLVQTLVEGKK